MGEVHPELAAFVRAMRENPDDDVIRLACADWFEEHRQDERAEFVRLQVQKERDPEWHGFLCLPERKCKNCRREDKLLHSASGQSYHVIAWAGPAKQLVPDGARWLEHLTYRRGFLESVTCSAADWLAHGDAVVLAHPVTVVRLTTWPELPVGDWNHTPAHVSRGPQYEIAGQMVEAPSHEEWNYPERMPGRTREWTAEMLARRWPGVAFELPPERYPRTEASYREVEFRPLFGD